MRLDALAAALQEYQGIVGALAGVFLTLVTTSLLRFTGKTTCHTTKWRLNKLYPNAEVAKNLDQMDGLEYGLSVDLFNPSDVPRGLRGFLVSIEASSGVVVVTQCPNDEDTRQSRGPFIAYDQIRVVNISPHSFWSLSLEGSFSREMYPLLFEPGSYIVNLIAVDPRGRKLKWTMTNYNLAGPTTLATAESE